jgi:hypothetical protein
VAESLSPSKQASGVWADAFRVERRGIDVRAGLAGALATSAPLAIGVAAGAPEIGITACFGGLNAALAVPRGALRERVGWGAGASLGCCAAAALATTVQESAVASAVAGFALVGLAAFLRALGRTGGLAGFVIGAIYVIMNGIPAAPLDVGERVLWFALGSLGGVVLMAAAYARDAPPRDPEGTPLAAVVVRGARQVGDAMAHDGVLRGHALRLATIVALTILVAASFDLVHGYWIPLTILAVLQPDEHASSVRAVQRGMGTLIGTAVIALVTVITGEEWLLLTAQAFAAFGLFALFSRGYFWLVVLLTPTALLTISAVDYQGDEDALQRAAWSALGIVIGVAVAELWWRLGPERARGRPQAGAERGP